ncbi:phosducin-like protein 3 [Arctopsyche grandis]|uniref:phosducin-like protein 3 n=1 Tax=Arctopsyche grandis TaxID=121162 RepID=UPI00406D989F
MEQVIQNIAQNVERQVDAELDKLNQLGTDDLDKLRENRLAEMKKRAQLKQEWLTNGHGEYTELSDEKEFFAITKKSKDIVCHFYKNDTARCKIVDMHLKILAHKHIETKFVKLDVERCPFLTERLRIKMIPTISLVKDSKTKDFIVGFTDLGNCDDFSTEVLEWRIAQSGAIEYNGDLLTPPDQVKKQKPPTFGINKRTIRGGTNSDDDDDLDVSD